MKALRDTPRGFLLLVPMAFALALAPGARAQPVVAGDTEANFTIFDHATSAPAHLSDFAGKIVVLDYFAYWCGWCAIDSPLTETDIQQYYATRGGNAAGIPVQVLSVSVDQTNSAATTAFIKSAGIEMEGDDILNQAWSQNGQGQIPTYVIINGVANAPGMKQWQVLFLEVGYSGPDPLRQAIDSVTLPQAKNPLTFTSQPMTQEVYAGSDVVFGAAAAGGANLGYQWSFNGSPISGQTGPTLLIPKAQASNSRDDGEEVPGIRDEEFAGDAVLAGHQRHRSDSCRGVQEHVARYPVRVDVELDRALGAGGDLRGGDLRRYGARASGPDQVAAGVDSERRAGHRFATDRRAPAAHDAAGDVRRGCAAVDEQGLVLEHRVDREPP